MKTQTHLEDELLGLIEFRETGLLSPRLRLHLADFSTLELKVAAGDLLDWLSLRGILRGRTQQVTGKTYPHVTQLLHHLPELFLHICVRQGHLVYRSTVSEDQQYAIEDFVKNRIWHPPWRFSEKLLEIDDKDTK